MTGKKREREPGERTSVTISQDFTLARDEWSAVLAAVGVERLQETG